MANVNQNLPMWSKAFWSQAERDKRQEAEDEKEYKRQLVEKIILQQMVNEGRITEQQAADAAAAGRQEKDIKAKKEIAIMADDADWYRMMYTEGSKSKLQRDLAEMEAKDKAEIMKLREKEDETARIGHFIRSFGSYGVPKDDPAQPTLRKLIGMPVLSSPAPSIVSPAAGTRKPITRIQLNGATNTPPAQPGQLPRSDSAAPALPAPTGPAPNASQPSTLSPDAQSFDDRLKREFELLQSRMKFLQPAQK